MLKLSFLASSNPGPNAPLEDGCKNSSIPSANAHSAVLAWKAAGFASSQLVLGVPAYAYISRSTASSLRQKRALGRTSGSSMTPVVPITVKFNSGISSNKELLLESIVSWNLLPPVPTMDLLVILLTRNRNRCRIDCADADEYEDDETQLARCLYRLRED
jgi:hypothetical protein